MLYFAHGYRERIELLESKLEEKDAQLNSKDAQILELKDKLQLEQARPQVRTSSLERQLQEALNEISNLVQKAVLDVEGLRGSKEEKCLPLPEAVTAQYFKLSPGGIKWQSMPRIIALCVKDDCSGAGPVGGEMNVDDNAEADEVGNIPIEKLWYTPREFDSCRGAVTSCDECEDQACHSPLSALMNTNPDDEEWWNPVTHVPNTDDVSITLDAGAAGATVRAVRWANFGDTVHDPKTIKVESADSPDGPWAEDAVMDVASLQGTKEEHCLPLPEAVTARYFKLSPGGIEAQSMPRIIALCEKEDCKPVPKPPFSPLESEESRGWKGKFYSGVGGKTGPALGAPLPQKLSDNLPGNVFAYMRALDPEGWKGKVYNVPTDVSQYDGFIEAREGILSSTPKMTFNEVEVKILSEAEAEWVREPLRFFVKFQLSRKSSYLFTWTGQIEIQNAGKYEFLTCAWNTQDASTLIIDGDVVTGLSWDLENDNYGCKLRSAELTEGSHVVEAEYWKSPQSQGEFHVMWKGADAKLTLNRVICTPEINYQRKDFNEVWNWYGDPDFVSTEQGVNWYSTWTGKKKITKAGKYDFRLCTEQGAELFIGGSQVVYVESLHGGPKQGTMAWMKDKCKEGSIYLEVGVHFLEVNWYASPQRGYPVLHVGWRDPEPQPRPRCQITGMLRVEPLTCGLATEVAHVNIANGADSWKRGDVPFVGLYFSPPEFKVDTSVVGDYCDSQESGFHSPWSWMANMEITNTSTWDPLLWPSSPKFDDTLIAIRRPKNKPIPDRYTSSLVFDTGEEGATVKAVRWAHLLEQGADIVGGVFCNAGIIHVEVMLNVELSGIDATWPPSNDQKIAYTFDDRTYLRGPTPWARVGSVYPDPGTTLEQCLKLPKAVNARYIKLTPHTNTYGVRMSNWDKQYHCTPKPRKVSICLTEDCSPSAPPESTTSAATKSLQSPSLLQQSRQAPAAMREDMPRVGLARELELEVSSVQKMLHQVGLEYKQRDEARHSRHLLTAQCMFSGYILVPTRDALSSREELEQKASTELKEMGLVPGPAISTSVEDISGGV